MLETVQKILESPAGSFSFIFGMMVLAGWVIYYVTKFFTKITIEHGQIYKRLDKTESDIEQIKTDVVEIKGSLRFITDMISKNDPVAKKKSPLSLNEFGEQLVESYNLDAMVSVNWEKINNALRGLKTKNPYDLQQFCIDTSHVDALKIKTSVFFTDADIEKIKIISYKTGVPLFSISRLIGILIRDRYFKENGIDVESIDMYDPDLQT